jgi:antitoxin PrlF
MSVATLTAKNQLTLRKEVVKHLGVKAGDKLTVDLLPDGRVALGPAPKGDNLEGFFGSLHIPGEPAISIEEINETIRKGWAGEL